MRQLLVGFLFLGYLASVTLSIALPGIILAGSLSFTHADHESSLSHVHSHRHHHDAHAPESPQENARTEHKHSDDHHTHEIPVSSGFGLCTTQPEGRLTPIEYSDSINTDWDNSFIPSPSLDSLFRPPIA